MKLLNKLAIVTGSGRGIGKAIALILAKEGCNVVITARTEKEIEQTKKEVIEIGRKAITVKCDVRLKNDIENLIKKTIAEFGKVDILINNAGVAFSKPLIETTEKEWDATIDTNLKGIFLCCKEVLPIMIRQRYGIIINISSCAGKEGYAGLAAYCASKFGVIGLTESLAEEFPAWIKVYAVCPGAVDTKMQAEISGKSYLTARRFMLKPEDVAKKVLQLCLPDCEVKSGSSIDVV